MNDGATPLLTLEGMLPVVVLQYFQQVAVRVPLVGGDEILVAVQAVFFKDDGPVAGVVGVVRVLAVRVTWP